MKVLPSSTFICYFAKTIFLVFVAIVWALQKVQGLGVLISWEL